MAIHNVKSVILVGDSIRMGYESTVRKGLEGAADVWAPAENGGTSRNVLLHLAEWVLSRRADVVHLNCGLHDIKRDFDHGTPQVTLRDYAGNVDSILRRLRTETSATIIWATSTPVNERRHHANKPFDRFEADVESYNAAASRSARRQGIIVNDLFKVVASHGRDSILTDDGVHFTPEGCTLLGKAVAACIRGVLVS